MASRIGTPLPRDFVVNLYVKVAAGFALLFLGLSNVGPRGKEFVQIDDGGVAVATKTGIERVPWGEIERVRILTTDAGPWGEDVFFLLEAPEGMAAPPNTSLERTILETGK